MKTIVAKPHPSVGKEDHPRKKVIPKNPRWSKKKGDNITIQALGYGVDDYIEGSVHKKENHLVQGWLIFFPFSFVKLETLNKRFSRDNLIYDVGFSYPSLLFFFFVLLHYLFLQYIFPFHAFFISFRCIEDTACFKCGKGYH